MKLMTDATENGAGSGGGDGAGEGQGQGKGQGQGQGQDKAPGFDNPNIATEEAMARHEKIVEDGFLTKLRKVLGKLPFAEELCAAYYCALDPETPTRVRGILLAALAYFVMPVDMIPDIVTGFGFTDDATVITTAIAIVSGHIKDLHHEQARDLLLKTPGNEDS